MNAKTGIIVTVVFLVLWFGFMALRESPGEKYERMQREDRNAGLGSKPAAKPDFAAADSYTFTLAATGTELKGDLHDAFLAALRAAIAPTGLNPVDGPKAGGGDLGTITVTVAVETQQFRGQQQRIRHQTGAIPFRLNGTVTVASRTGKSSWDGTRELSATVPLPDEIREGLIGDTIARQFRDLARQAVARLKQSGKFTR